MTTFAVPDEQYHNVNINVAVQTENRLFQSSRTLTKKNCAQFIVIQFNKSGRISGAANRTYLLEMSRVCQISNPERNYQCFYLLCAVVPEDTEKYKLEYQSYSSQVQPVRGLSSGADNLTGGDSSMHCYLMDASNWGYLCQLASNDQAKSGEMGFWSEGAWIWQLKFGRVLYQWEDADKRELEEGLNHIQPKDKEDDKIVWTSKSPAGLVGKIP